MNWLLQQKSSRAWPLYLVLLSLPAFLFLYIYGLPINDDGPLHLLRIARLHDAVTKGILFPRWMPDQLLGYGYPTLNYYASATYYGVEFLHLLGLPLYWAYVVAQSLLVIFAATGMYLFARDLMGDPRFWPPMIAAIAYIYSPYLIQNIYVRGAFAEVGAQALLPWLLWSFRRIWRSERAQAYLLSSTLLLAALAFTHTISLLLVPPFLLGYLAILAWDADRRALRLRWSAIAIGGAMAITAFFWLPLIAERDNVSALAYAIAQQRFLPTSFLEARNFLYTSLTYIYTNDLDYRFGIVQALGILIGLPFAIHRAIHRSKEWWYWIAILLFCGVMMTKLTEPIWFGSKLFTIIQFPWRLLALVQIPVALLTALPFCYIPNRFLRAAASAIAIAFLIWVYVPRLPWIPLMSPASSFSMPMSADFEAKIKKVIDGGNIVTSLQEFRPRWVSTNLVLEPQTVESVPISSTVTPLAAQPLHLRLRTSASSAFPLRLNTFYFPGWQITMDDTTRLTPYPSTNLGLLTAEVPPGEHLVDVEWAGTRLAFWAALISQLGLLALIIWQARQPRRFLWSLPLVFLLLLALFATYWHPPLAGVVVAESESQVPGMRLVGFGTPEITSDGIAVYPYWYALQTAPPNLEVRWQLLNSAGQVVAQTETTPFYDVYAAHNWPANTLIDDAQMIPLPADLPAGSYQILMSPLRDEDDMPLFTTIAGAVTLDAPIAQSAPPHRLEVYLGDDVVLKGYDLRIAENLSLRPTFLPQSPDVALAYAGESLAYTLYWELLQETDKPYVGFVHLTDRQGKPIVQRDQSPGPVFLPVAIWGVGRLYPDDYMLTIPKETLSGLYQPQVGMYDWEEVDRFDVRIAGSEEINDHYLLPPVKIINRAINPIGIAAGAHFGDMAELLRYDIHNAEGKDATTSFPVKAGSTVTLTAFYRVENPTPVALTRFIQMRDAANQIVAQLDSEPQDGQNPTWAWVKGEVVQDTVYLPIPPETPPGEYVIYLGFYEPSGNFARLPVSNRQGVRLPNDELPLPLGANPLVVQVVK